MFKTEDGSFFYCRSEYAHCVSFFFSSWSILSLCCLHPRGPLHFPLSSLFRISGYFLSRSAVQSRLFFPRSLNTSVLHPLTRLASVCCPSSRASLCPPSPHPLLLCLARPLVSVPLPNCPFVLPLYMELCFSVFLSITLSAMLIQIGWIGRAALFQ